MSTVPWFHSQLYLDYIADRGKWAGIKQGGELDVFVG
jgi:hypothetical protein